MLSFAYQGLKIDLMVRITNISPRLDPTFLNMPTESTGGAG